MTGRQADRQTYTHTHEKVKNYIPTWHTIYDRRTDRQKHTHTHTEDKKSMPP